MRDRPVLFLDFDGVLNDWRWIGGDARKAWRASHPRGWDDVDAQAMWQAGDLDPARVEHLNAIVERTGAAVVLHTSWRLVFRFAGLVEALRARGFRGEVLGVTDVEIRDRSESIRAWLRANPDVGPWAVLDDEPLREEPIIGRRFVWTFDPNPEGADEGLNVEHVERVVALLTGGGR